jgi:hypothetical protein
MARQVKVKKHTRDGSPVKSHTRTIENRKVSSRKMIESQDIEREMIKAGVPVDSWATDLYSKVTPKSKELIDNYEYKNIVKTFRSQIDGQLWYDIPFAHSKQNPRG